jgi:hypothetical protein
VKILDFGLARTSESAAPGATATVAALTDPGTVLGTAGYMAPEQIRGQPVDRRADLFALGGRALRDAHGTARVPGESTVETLNAILKDDPPDLTSVRFDLAPGLERIVRHCLEKNPAQRFQSAQDVVFALETLSGSGAASVTTRAPLVAVERPSRWKSLAVGAVGVAALTLSALAFTLWRGPRVNPLGWREIRNGAEAILQSEFLARRRLRPVDACRSSCGESGWPSAF